MVASGVFVFDSGSLRTSCMNWGTQGTYIELHNSSR